MFLIQTCFEFKLKNSRARANSKYAVDNLKEERVSLPLRDGNGGQVIIFGRSRGAVSAKIAFVDRGGHHVIFPHERIVFQPHSPNKYCSVALIKGSRSKRFHGCNSTFINSFDETKFS